MTENEDEEQILGTDEKQMITQHANANASFHAKETSSSPNPKLKVSNYQFPNVQERLQYYMGDWYNKSGWTVPDSDCKLLRKRTDYLDAYGMDIILHTTDIKECIDRHAHEGIAKYCRDAYDAINNTLDEADGNNNRWIVSFGDRTQGRHYKDLEDYHRKIVKKGKEVPWSEKLSKVFWRGRFTRGRLDHLAQWINYDINYTDIAFSKVVQTRSDFMSEYVKSQYSRKGQSLLEMNRYKYLLSIEGNDVATGLKWMLYSNSVVFMSRPTVATWAMEDLLVPFVHYIPLANDYSNLLEMVKWANEHDVACQEISKRATEFMEHLWMSEQAKRDTEYLQKALVTSYVNHFDDALTKCTPDTMKMVNNSSIHQKLKKKQKRTFESARQRQSKRV